MQTWWRRAVVVSVLAAGVSLAQTGGTAGKTSPATGKETSGGAARGGDASSPGAPLTTGSSGAAGAVSSEKDAVGSAGQGDGATGGASGTKPKKKHHKAAPSGDGSGSGTPGTSRSNSTESTGSSR
jgi:hypothetical protein